MSLAMTAAEREAFLSGVQVGVFSVADEGGRAPLTVPMWYDYQPGGEVVIITDRSSRKTRLIRQTGRLSLCVQSGEVPYKYASVEGPVAGIQETVTVEERRAMARRYLGAERGDAYVAATTDRTDSMVLIRMRPVHWLSEDQTRLSAMPR
jgi:PPOX class probable F420-dependent enzyme